MVKPANNHHSRNKESYFYNRLLLSGGMTSNLWLSLTPVEHDFHLGEVYP